MPIFSGTTPKDNYNRPLYGFHGQYTLSPGVSLPYFVTAMPIERVVDELKIAEQIAPSLDNRWSLNELFQREVDRGRVDRELVRGYLADPHKLKFFNALTIVLIPKAGDAVVSPEIASSELMAGPPIPWDGSDSEDAAWSQHDPTLRVSFGGAQYVRIGDQARLRWDLDRIHAVAVDGQHRLVALQDYKEKHRHKALSKEEQQTTVPIIVLLIAPQAGYKNEKSLNKQSVRSIARELFTDLNKNAKTVDNARQLVLDDWDIYARCVKELVTDEAARDCSDRLPLTLIRWQEAINRFDTSYYLNSLVHLKMLVEDILDLPSLKPMDDASVRAYIRSLGDMLGESGQLRDSETGRTLLEVYDQDYCDADGEPQTPFARLPHAYLEIAVEGFQKYHKPWIIRLLTELTPYRDLLNYARKHNLIEGAFGKWHAQTKRHQETIKQGFLATDPSWFKVEIKDHIDSIESMKGEKNDSDWSFKAIFQKAMLRLARVVVIDGAEGEKRLGNIDTVIAFFNSIHSKGLLKLKSPLEGHQFGLWAFIGLNAANQKIKVTAAVEENILALLRLWYYANRKTRIDEMSSAPDDLESRPQSDSSEAVQIDPRKLLSFFEAKKNSVLWPEADKAADRLRTAMSSPILYKAHGLIDPDGDEQKKKMEEERTKLVTKRLVAILETGLVGISR